MVKANIFRKTLGILSCLLFLLAYVAPDFLVFHNHHLKTFSSAAVYTPDGGERLQPDLSSPTGHECALCLWKNQRETPAKHQAFRTYVEAAQNFKFSRTSVLTPLSCPSSAHARAPPA